jgi:predicted RNase H-like HicB family nuclease
MMSIADEAQRQGTPLQIPHVDWTEFADNVYVCRAVLCPEPEGGFSIHAASLPGVVSQGDTKDEAMSAIEEAFGEAIKYYLEVEGRIPWETVDEVWPSNAEKIQILVNA